VNGDGHHWLRQLAPIRPEGSGRCPQKCRYLIRLPAASASTSTSLEPIVSVVPLTHCPLVKLLRTPVWQGPRTFRAAFSVAAEPPDAGLRRVTAVSTAAARRRTVAMPLPTPGHRPSARRRCTAH